MKIKTRTKMISEYNEKYIGYGTDLEKCLKRYFRENNLNFEKACLKAKERAVAINEERKYETIHITMYEYPMKTDRPRTFNGTTFSPNAKLNKTYFEKALKKIVKDIKLINTPSEITIRAFLPMPTGIPPEEIILFETGLLHPIDKPDYDNIGKCYTDILTDVLISDDDIFYSGKIIKYYSVLPRVEIDITSLSKHESKYIYKKMKARKSIKEAISNGILTLEKISGI